MRDLESLSLVVLNYKSYDDTVFCVDRLLSFGTEAHIIVVDNMSPDDSFEKLRQQYVEERKVDVLQTTKNGGYSYGNNFGMRYAIATYRSKYVGVLNPDVIIDGIDVIEAMVQALDDIDKLAVVGASVVSASGIYNPNLSGWDIPSSRNVVCDHFLLNARKLRSRNMKFLPGNVGQVECVAGCFFIANSERMSDMGFLDENVFLYNEENILGIRCKRAGYIEGVVLDKFYVHNHKYKKHERMSFRKKINKTEVGYRSRKYMCKTYYSKAILPLLFLVDCLNKTYLALAYVRNEMEHLILRK